MIDIIENGLITWRNIAITMAVLFGCAYSEASTATDTVSVVPTEQHFHIVGRGETWNLVSKRYEVSEETLRMLNPLVETLHTGIRLNLPPDVHAPLSAAAILKRIIAADYNESALDAMKAGNYSEAVKWCNKALVACPTSQLYATRGMAQAARGKWRQASEDYERAMNGTDDEDFRKSIEPLYNDALKRHQEWRDRRGTFWNSLLLSIARTGVETYAAYNGLTTATPPPGVQSSFYAASMSQDSAINLQLPTSLDFRNYLNDQPLFEYHLDEYGRIYSTANGAADALMRQNAAFNRDMYGMVSNLASSGNYAQASSIMAQMQSNNSFSVLQENSLRMPFYGLESKVESNITSDSNGIYTLQDEYDAYARLAEKWSNGIEVHGGGFDDKDGQHHSEMKVKDGTSGYASVLMRQGVRNAQKRMKEIRNMADSQGITLTASEWESSKTGVY